MATIEYKYEIRCLPRDQIGNDFTIDEALYEGRDLLWTPVVCFSLKIWLFQ